jgi:hypothetical protein
MASPLARPAVLLGAVGLAATVALGCSTGTTTVTLTPITGIVVPASDLTSGRGCGSRDGELLKYAALVQAVDPNLASGGTGAVLAKGVYDCFADAIFTNLAYGADATLAYTVEIRAFDASQYAAQKDAVDALANSGAVLDVAAFRALSGTRFTCTATLRLDVLTKAACAGDVPDAGDAGSATDGGDAVDAGSAADASDAGDATDAGDAASD